MILRAALAVSVIPHAASAASPLPTVPRGFEIQVAAEFPVVERPVMACFDERGRLFLVDSSGANEPFEKLLKDPPHRIVVVEDTDGDGTFDKRTLFADKLVMPQGVLPYRGAVYTASPPSVWKLEDTDNDGVCDKRTEIVTGFGSNGNAADIHGPFLGPDGWLYLCDGRHGHKVERSDGTFDQGLAGGIFRFQTDGRGFERVCGGGFDNPVEIDFTDEGEMLGTVNILHGNPRQDCLVHWVGGGVYPRADQEQCLAEFKRTGDLLPPIKEFGHVAVAGMTRYRSEAFGAEYRDNLFITFFNRHKVIRSILERSGSTFTSREEEFLSSDEKDFHPTDVLEDADGSLLVINTGGWFRLGCPVSEIAKPDVLGAIYRIRKTGMKRIDDPRGLALQLGKKSPDELLPYLDDPRPAVQERTIDLLAAGDVTNGSEVVEEWLNRGPDTASARQRRNAIWAIERCVSRPFGADSDSRISRIKRLLTTLENRSKASDAVAHDPNDSVRLTATIAAARSYSATFSRTHAEGLRSLVVDDTPPVRMAAARLIARKKILKSVDQDNVVEIESNLRAAAIASLFDSIRKGGVDRFLEHALIYALIQIDDADQTLPYLNDPNPEVRRAALIALDQMDHGRLTRERVTPLLDTDDPQLRKTALAVISARKGWATELVELLRGWLAESPPSEEHLSLLRGVLLAQAADPAIQQVISEALAAEKTASSVRLLLWEVVYRAPLGEIPSEWKSAIERTLHGRSSAEIRQTIAIINDRRLSPFDGRLVALAADPNMEIEVRIEALAAVAPRLKSLDSGQFALLAANLKPETPPLLLLAAARGLADAPLTASQLQELTRSLAGAGPLALPVLLLAFRQTGDEAVGLSLVRALNECAAAENLSAEELAGIVRKYPEHVQNGAAGLLKRLGGANLEEQRSRLAELKKLIDPPGDVPRGREVFFGKKGACSNCHTIANQGGRVGPDLTKIGASRSATDLLEAIVFPSASFTREFRPYIIVTDSGKVHTGVISRQTADAIHLRTADLSEIRIPRAAIEEMKESNTSIMPKGLDSTLSSQEFRDLLAYLCQLK